MQKIYGTTSRHDGLKQIGRSRWVIYYGFGKDNDSDDYGWDYRHEFDHRPTLDEIREVIFEQITENTRQRILAGFSWQGHLVWLSQENQLNYMRDYNLVRNGERAMWPTYKFGTDDEPVLYTFDSVDEFFEFTQAWSRHIDESINANRVAKAAVDWTVYNPE